MNVIINLQEVAIDWVGKLEVFFAQRNYRFITALYGSKFSGYMGVGVAYPTTLYELADCKTVCVGNTKRWNRPRRPGRCEQLNTSVTQWVANIFAPLTFAAKFVANKFGCNCKPKDRRPLHAKVQSRAAKRFNRAVVVKLRRRETGTEFCVATYHLPCDFKLKPVVTLHSALYAMTAQRFARDTPLILTGDFNSTPDSGAYELLTTGHLDEKHEEYPVVHPDDKWKPNVRALRSAYHAANGKEPPFTNKAVRDLWGGRNSFQGTLDYLFCSEGVKVVDTYPVFGHFPDEIGNAKSLPVLQAPSDHLMIGASFQIDPPPIDTPAAASISEVASTSTAGLSKRPASPKVSELRQRAKNE